VKKLTSSDDVAVLDQHTLGRTRRARRVHDTRQIFGSGGNGLGRVLLTQLDQLVKADDVQVGVCALQLLNVLGVGIILSAVDDD
jgi:hypothetical protein